MQDLCKEAATTQIALQRQLTANKRLDFELSPDSKNCGQLKKDGISFHPKSPYYSVCADVVVVNKDKIAPHIHSIPTSSKAASQSKDRMIPVTLSNSAPLQTQSSPFSPE